MSIAIFIIRNVLSSMENGGILIFHERMNPAVFGRAPSGGSKTWLGEFHKNLLKKLSDPPCLGEALRRATLISIIFSWKDLNKEVVPGK